MEDNGTVREFATGATRDTGMDKPEPWGFESAIVSQRYATYMHGKRVQSDGKLRDSDNWKKGMPVSVYYASLSRHVSDLRLIMEGYPELASDTDIETVLCAVKFNVEGMLHEIIKADLDGTGYVP